MRTALATAAVTCLLAAAHARGADVRVDLRTTEAPATQPAPADAAATRPAAGEPAVSVLAVPGHDFGATFRTAGRAVEVGGSVRALADGRFRVTLHFADRARGVAAFTTVVDVRAGEAVEVQGLRSAGGAGRTTVMTLTPVAAAPG
ncbi:MAG: hypothetical protein JWO31_3871 [Phycisphaerales bacterium]|nr:hypothetical protein [Phycisphaerales bacterium]